MYSRKFPFENILVNPLRKTFGGCDEVVVCELNTLWHSSAATTEWFNQDVIHCNVYVEELLSFSKLLDSRFDVGDKKNLKNHY